MAAASSKAVARGGSIRPAMPDLRTSVIALDPDRLYPARVGGQNLEFQIPFGQHRAGARTRPSLWMSSPPTDS